MGPRTERRYWRAVESLRQAEALASLASAVSGPADAPPAAGQESSWITDWTARAARALERGKQLIASANASAKARGHKIIDQVKKGLEAVRTLPVAAEQKAKKAIEALGVGVTTAGAMWIVGLLVSAYIGLKLLKAA
jgi:hypothetical protein